jgi:hypothetical protein
MTQDGWALFASGFLFIEDAGGLFSVYNNYIKDRLISYDVVRELGRCIHVKARTMCLLEFILER